MKLTECVKQYEQCMKDPGERVSCDGCPLLNNIKLNIGDKTDGSGGIIWTISGCGLMSMFEAWLKNKKFTGAFIKG